MSEVKWAEKISSLPTVGSSHKSFGSVRRLQQKRANFQKQFKRAEEPTEVVWNAIGSAASSRHVPTSQNAIVSALWPSVRTRHEVRLKAERGGKKGRVAKGIAARLKFPNTGNWSNSHEIEWSQNTQCDEPHVRTRAPSRAVKRGPKTNPCVERCDQNSHLSALKMIPHFQRKSVGSQAGMNFKRRKKTKGKKLHYGVIIKINLNHWRTFCSVLYHVISLYINNVATNNQK